jgi:catechol 2,3-dioxygenase-like lactoylglutathione lyase family enzyme
MLRGTAIAPGVKETRKHEKDTIAWRTPYYAHRRRPAKLHRLLGRGAGHALHDPDEGHLYFDPGDGRLITIFTNENRRAMHNRTPMDPGCVHHIAFEVDRAMFDQVLDRLKERGIGNSGVKDRGFMHSIYFKDPLGLLIELACYAFIPPRGSSHAEVMLEAHKIRVAAGDHHIERQHLADASALIVERSQASLSEDRGAKNPYR